MKISRLTRMAAVFAAAAMFAGVLGGCSSSAGSDNAGGSETEQFVQEEPALEDVEILNFTAPEIGEKIAVIEVKDYGTIKIKLFPEEAAKGVENFIGLAEMNYYDEIIFHRVIKDFMDQTGDPRGNGTGGNSMWGGTFEGGVSPKLFHFTGAVAYANSSGTDTNGSQFYIVNTPDGFVNCGGYYDENGEFAWQTDMDAAGMTLPNNLKQAYTEHGGTPFLDGSYTVFGQVFEGMDVVRAIAEAEVDENDKPLTQIVMQSVRIVEYDGN
ncbi:MAG: peptidylprolyl isomerase [Huintestinicola sp.]